MKNFFHDPFAPPRGMVSSMKNFFMTRLRRRAAWRKV
jgi:hypothetical protein